MGRGLVRSRSVRSGEGDEGDAEGPAGLEEHGGVVTAQTTVSGASAMKILDKFPDKPRRAKKIQTPDTISLEELQKGISPSSKGGGGTPCTKPPRSW